MRRYEKLCAGLLVVLGLVALARAEWTNIWYEHEWLPGNVNGGAGTDGYSYTSIKPSTGDWTAGYDLRAQVAQLNVWSANTILFNDWNTATSDGGGASLLVLKINLSEPISSATWDPAGIPSPLAGMKGEYSTDGSTWCVAADYSSSNDPGLVTLNTGTTSSLYIRWSTDTGYWNMNSSGELTFTPAPEPATLCLLAAGGIGVLVRRKRKP